MPVMKLNPPATVLSLIAVAFAWMAGVQHAKDISCRSLTGRYVPYHTQGELDRALDATAAMNVDEREGENR